MFGWTLGVTSVYVWFVCLGTTVEPQMKATQTSKLSLDVDNLTYLLPEPYGFKHTKENFRNLS